SPFAVYRVVDAPLRGAGGASISLASLVLTSQESSMRGLMNLLLPILATLIWAASTVVNRLAVGLIDPAAISLYRWLVATLVITPFVLASAWNARQVIRTHFVQ